MRGLAIAIVTTWFFGAACARDPTRATADAGDGPPVPADVRGDQNEDGGEDASADGQRDSAGTTDAEPPACLMPRPDGQPCEPVDARCGHFGCGELSCVCQEAGWHCTLPLCP